MISLILKRELNDVSLGRVPGPIKIGKRVQNLGKIKVRGVCRKKNPEKV